MKDDQEIDQESAMPIEPKQLDHTELQILNLLKDKSSLKQKIYRQGREIFDRLKVILKEIVDHLIQEMDQYDDSVELYFKETNEMEAEIKFGGDVLIFSLHSNVFKFDESHGIMSSTYVEEDPSRAYCNTIQIYNFLSDSLKYSRLRDIGYLIARVFINKEKHFFVEGKRQLGFLYNDFEHMEMNDVYLRAIAESAILYALDFDLLVPPYNEVKEITVQQRLADHIYSQQTTAKRLGFKFEADRLE